MCTIRLVHPIRQQALNYKQPQARQHAEEPERPSRARLFYAIKQLRFRLRYRDARVLKTAHRFGRSQAFNVRLFGINIDCHRHAGSLDTHTCKVEAGFTSVVEQSHVLIAMFADGNGDRFVRRCIKHSLAGIRLLNIRQRQRIADEPRFLELAGGQVRHHLLENHGEHRRHRHIVSIQNRPRS